ncbi:MAG TPA: hypothetical protein PLF13_00435 [candidate division Zixibacteria bacterium]|nr:hypothetical protein [candidate division Zixibacteria bacterium]
MKALILLQLVLVLSGFIAMSVGAWKKEAGKPASATDDPVEIETERRRGSV